MVRLSDFWTADSTAVKDATEMGKANEVDLSFLRGVEMTRRVYAQKQARSELIDGWRVIKAGG